MGSTLIRTIGSLSLLIALGTLPVAAQQENSGKELGVPAGTPRSIRDATGLTGEARAAAEEQRVLPRLMKALQAKGFDYGAPILIRIFKQNQKLELWMLDGYEYKLFKTYSICNFSGTLGPKLKEGDRQAPEGFYFVGESQLNPDSDFHLSFDIGYPNTYDRLHHRTGNHLMIHGGCVSAGCYAMTDEGITEIYALADAALRAGQSLFEVHIFPFRMTPANMAVHAKSRWADFWANLKTGYDYFEAYHRPPIIYNDGKRYAFGPLVSTASATTAAAESSSVAENCTQC